MKFKCLIIAWNSVSIQTVSDQKSLLKSVLRANIIYGIMIQISYFSHKSRGFDELALLGESKRWRHEQVELGVGERLPQRALP